MIKEKDFIEYAAILMLVLASGGNFWVRSIYVFAVVCLLLLGTRRNMMFANIRILVLLLLFVIFNTCIVNTSPTIASEVVVLVIRLVGCAIIASNICVEDFKNKYYNIMTILCTVSLFWFALILIGINPPLLKENNGVFASIFHTVGFTLDTKRNAGVFSEPGLFQIFINIAVVFMIFDNNISLKVFKRRLLLYTITLLTAFSAMGYICYAINLILCIKYRGELVGGIAKSRKIRSIFIALLILFGAGIEVFTHFFSNFITTWNSYSSRHDDTLMGLMIAKKYFLYGVGIANDVSAIWQSYFGSLGKLELYHNPIDLSRSNGFVNSLFTAGVPFTLIYLFLIVRHSKIIILINDKFDMVMIAILFILFFFGEPYMYTPFFLSFLFNWNSNQKNRLVQENN